MKNIATLNKISPVGLARLTEDYAITDDLSEAVGIILRSADLHDTEFPEGMLGIARAGAGVNNIPVEECAKKGIAVFNTPGANANAVKELVLAAMLINARNLVPAARWERELAEDVADVHTTGNVDVLKVVEKNKSQFAGREIAGKTLGVIGMGAIGVLVANAAEDLGMQVMGYDPYLPESSAQVMHDTITMVDDLTDLVKDCDYVTIHVPVNNGTRGMITREIIDAMKPGCVFLNFSRNTLVDEEALIAALTEDRLAGYVTDFGTEALLATKNVQAFPHLGASTQEAEDNCAIMATNQLMDYIDNGNIVNSVNYPACNLGKIDKEAACRLAVLGEDMPDMVQKISDVLGENPIVDMASKVRGSYSYCLMDLKEVPAADSLAVLGAWAGIRKVRLLEK